MMSQSRVPGSQDFSKPDLLLIYLCLSSSLDVHVILSCNREIKMGSLLPGHGRMFGEKEVESEHAH